MARKEKAAADERHVTQSICNILAIDKATYQQLTFQLSPREIEGYRDLCTEMLNLKDNRCWLTRLLVASPCSMDCDDAGPKNSSLLAAYELQGPLPYRGKEIADYRRQFLEGLWKQLRRPEVQQYGETLEVALPHNAKGKPLGFLPDIRGVQLIYKLDGLFTLCATEKESHLRHHTLPLEQRVELAKVAHEAARKAATATLKSLELIPYGENNDSLAARLMISIALNRAELEALEYQRMERLATKQLVQLIRALTTQGIEQLPLYLDQQEFGEWLVTLFGEYYPNEESQTWRRLKPMHPDRLFKRAQEVIRQIDDGSSGIISVRDERAALNMSALTLAWSYCTTELHDLRVPMSRPRNLVNGRTDPKQICPTMMLYHRRQLASMLMSQQDMGLSSERLEAYHEVNQNKRVELRTFINEHLRGISVAEWEAMSTGIDIFINNLIAQGSKSA